MPLAFPMGLSGPDLMGLLCWARTALREELGKAASTRPLATELCLREVLFCVDAGC